MATGYSTNEYLLPVSYGLTEHLCNFKGNSLKVYLWLHFNKTVKGEKTGLVIFNYEEIASALKLSKSTVKTSLDHLVKIRMIDYVQKSNSRWSDTVVRILKNKTMADFTVLKKNGKVNGRSNGKGHKPLKGKRLQTPKDVKGCTSKEVALRVINEEVSSWLAQCNALVQVLTENYELSAHSSLNRWRKEFPEELVESVLRKLHTRGKKLNGGWYPYISKVLEEKARNFRPPMDTVEEDPEYQVWLKEKEA